LQWTIHTVQHVARLVRDQISADTWRVLNSLKVDEFGFREPIAANRRLTTGTLSDVLEMLESLLISLTAFGGLAMESMVRGRRWQFLDMGRRIERAIHTLTLIRSTLATVEDNEAPVLEAVLEVAESSITYRRRYLSSLQAAPVLDLLLLDESNPRSLAFQLVALADNVEQLTPDDETPRRPPEQRIMLAILTHLRLADIELLARPNLDGSRQHLVDWLVWLSEQLPLLSDTIAQNYLTHVAASRHLAALNPEARS
jgi:uncharacterized alpha-E superfamily protein